VHWDQPSSFVAFWQEVVPRCWWPDSVASTGLALQDRSKGVDQETQYMERDVGPFAGRVEVALPDWWQDSVVQGWDTKMGVNQQLR